MKADDGYQRTSRGICRDCVKELRVRRRGLEPVDRGTRCATCFGAGEPYVSLPVETLERVTSILSDVIFARFSTNQIMEHETPEAKAARFCSLVVARDRYMAELVAANPEDYV